ncbi:MAG: hypothetical protein JWP13_795 [Candidatus Saccharibacteria bacterium]|nr:hypothetical protein [Candidatus Saccharibacteria bacterium]
MSIETSFAAGASPQQSVELHINQKVAVIHAVHELPPARSHDALGREVREVSTIVGTIEALPSDTGPETIHIDQGEGQPTMVIPLWSSEFVDVVRGLKRQHQVSRLRAFGILPIEDTFSSEN